MSCSPRNLAAISLASAWLALVMAPAALADHRCDNDDDDNRCNEAPTAVLEASTPTAAPDQVVGFDATKSSDRDGSIVRHEWDLDGDGSYETDTGAVASSSRTYPTERSLVVGLRVTDDRGATATATRALTVALPAPELGRTFRADPVSGRVLMKPGGAALEKPAMLPMGSVVDATGGRVRLTFATAPGDRDRLGPTQSGVVYGGEFGVFQSPTESLTVFRLVGDAAECPDRGVSSRRAGAAEEARAAAKPRKRRARRARKTRRLWVEADGAFRTEGRNAAAVVRGTRWLTEEQCDGTLVHVARGSVQVRDHVRGRDVTVAQGKRYFARDACTSRRRFRIRLFIPRGASVRSVDVRVLGRKLPVSYDGGYSALIDLRKMPKGRFLVRIKVVLADGTRLSGTRSYNTCRSRIRSRFPPAL